jgi:hypothetical protein
MTYERVQKASSWSSQPQEKTSPFARRPFSVPAQAPTQQEIENEAIQQNKLEAFGLELQAKHGTITPQGQERLTVLQAKMDAFWQQRRESIERRGGNILQRLLNQGATSKDEPPPMIQTKLSIGEPGDQYEQEADQVAARVVNQINAPAPQPSTQGESVQREELPEEEKLMMKPQVGIVQRYPNPGDMSQPPSPSVQRWQANFIQQAGSLQRQEMPNGDFIGRHIQENFWQQRRVQHNGGQLQRSQPQETGGAAQDTEPLTPIGGTIEASGGGTGASEAYADEAQQRPHASTLSSASPIIQRQIGEGKDNALVLHTITGKRYVAHLREDNKYKLQPLENENAPVDEVTANNPDYKLEQDYSSDTIDPVRILQPSDASAN